MTWSLSPCDWFLDELKSSAGQGVLPDTRSLGGVGAPTALSADLQNGSKLHLVVKTSGYFQNHHLDNLDNDVI